MMAGLVVFDLGFDPELLVREWAGRVLGLIDGLGVCVLFVWILGVYILRVRFGL